MAGRGSPAGPLPPGMPCGLSEMRSAMTVGRRFRSESGCLLTARSDVPSGMSRFLLEMSPCLLETGAFLLETRKFPLEMDSFLLETHKFPLETGSFLLETHKFPLETGAFLLEIRKLLLETHKFPLEIRAFPTETGACPMETGALPWATHSIGASERRAQGGSGAPSGVEVWHDLDHAATRLRDAAPSRVRRRVTARSEPGADRMPCPVRAWPALRSCERRTPVHYCQMSIAMLPELHAPPPVAILRQMPYAIRCTASVDTSPAIPLNPCGHLQ